MTLQFEFAEVTRLLFLLQPGNEAMWCLALYKTYFLDRMDFELCEWMWLGL